MQCKCGKISIARNSSGGQKQDEKQLSDWEKPVDSLLEAPTDASQQNDLYKVIFYGFYLGIRGMFLFSKHLINKSKSVK